MLSKQQFLDRIKKFSILLKRMFFFKLYYIKNCLQQKETHKETSPWENRGKKPQRREKPRERTNVITQGKTADSHR